MPTEALTLKYRPTTFADIAGQREHAAILQKMADTDQIPPALLISGPSGTGKTSAARILASAIDAGDIIEIDAASNGGVDEVRRILEIVRFSTGGSYRVIILDEAHRITTPGWEAFLKTLEEPPANTIFILCSTAPYKIPDTILGRCIEFNFRSVSPGDIAQRLAKIIVAEGLALTRDLVLYIANRAEGDLRSAVNAVDLAARAGIATVDEYRERVGDQDPGPALLAVLMTGDPARIFSVLDAQLASVGSPSQIMSALIGTIRDLFVIKAGGALAAGGQGLELRKQMASRIDQDRLFVAIRILWDVKTKTRNDDPRGNLELALMLIGEAFARGSLISPAAPVVHSEQTPASAPRKMTMAELQKDS